MIVYRGDSSKNFEVQKHISSRYGFNALFFTTSIELARLYAIHRAKECRMDSGGFVYQFNIQEPFKKVNFNNEITHSRHFRNLMYQLHSEDLPSVLITNTYDYPSKDLMNIVDSDLLIVYDFELIYDFEKIEENIKN